MFLKLQIIKGKTVFRRKMTVIKWKVGTNRLPLVWLFPFRGIDHTLSSPALVQLLLLLEGEDRQDLHCGFHI